jgi:hypothetical protein
MKQQNYFSRSVLLLLTVLLSLSLLSGCGGDQKKKADAPKEAPKVQNLSISTGSQSGTYYPLGVAIANVLTNAKIGVNITAEATGGSIENVRMIGTKQTDIAFVESMVADWAFGGKEMFKDKKVENVRGLISLYGNSIQTVVKANSGINSYADLKGKKVSVGVQGGSSPVAMMVVLESYGLTMSDIRPQYLAFGPAMDLLKDGQVDAVLVDAGAPNSAIIDISTQHKVKILSIDPANIQKIRTKYPYFSDVTTIAKGTYKGIDDAVTTTGSLATLCVRADMPEAQVYTMLKTIFDKKADIAKVHEKGNSIDLKQGPDGFSIPLHPGAIKYYKEKGVLK